MAKDMQAVESLLFVVKEMATRLDILGQAWHHLRNSEAQHLISKYCNLFRNPHLNRPAIEQEIKRKEADLLGAQVAEV